MMSMCIVYQEDEARSKKHESRRDVFEKGENRYILRMDSFLDTIKFLED